MLNLASKKTNMNKKKSYACLISKSDEIYYEHYLSSIQTHIHTKCTEISML